MATAKVGSTNISYTYDIAGVRSSKTVGSTTYKFTTLSGLVTRQTGGGKTIDFVYDENNQPLAMKYNNTLYYYVLNAQGDVVRIVNSSRNVVASYTYDPWGKIISSSGTLADVNPLRYRGYYYDSETGFYYLQSRYYDPEIGRFINADSYASTDATGLLSTNMFAYCENNPVTRVDPTGEVFWDILDVFMAALSWDDFLESPSLVNLGWAALDTLALLPGVPSSGYARRGVELASYLKKADKAVDVYATWRDAENALRHSMNSVISQGSRTIVTNKGIRICDALNIELKAVGEAKYGYQSLSAFIKREIEKDKCLMRQGYTVEWHFYRSQITGKGGPSKPLRAALEAACIRIIEHY